MEKSLKEIAKLLDFDNSFFEEIESFGRLGFFEIDLIRGKLKASPNFKKLFNLPEKSLYKVEEYGELIHPDDIAEVNKSFNICLKERRNFVSEYRVIVKGDVRYIRGQSIFISDERGEPAKVVGMKQEITEQKLAEIERQKYVEELEHAHDLTTTIVHDLKAPLHNIGMIAEILKGDVPEEKERLLEVLEKSCQRSFEIIDDVLESRFAERDISKTEKEWHDIHQPINKAVSTLYYTAQKKNIKILTSLEPDSFAFIYPQRLQRAIENLLSNAIKFSHRDSKVEVSLHRKKKAFVIKIKDFGIGMNEFQRALLFEKENFLSRDGIEGEKSSGLGLNIVKKIVDQHKGKIKVESRDSGGTTFFIELPKE